MTTNSQQSGGMVLNHNERQAAGFPLPALFMEAYK